MGIALAWLALGSSLSPVVFITNLQNRCVQKLFGKDDD